MERRKYSLESFRQMWFFKSWTMLKKTKNEKSNRCGRPETEAINCLIFFSKKRSKNSLKKWSRFSIFYNFLHIEIWKFASKCLMLPLYCRWWRWWWFEPKEALLFFFKKFVNISWEGSWASPKTLFELSSVKREENFKGPAKIVAISKFKLNNRFNFFSASSDFVSPV